MIRRGRGSGVPSSLALSHEHRFALRRGAAQWVWCAAGVAAALTLPALLPPFWIHVANLCLLAAIGAIGLNLLTGNARLVSLGQAAFLGTGAFAAGLAARAFQAPAIVTLPVAALAGAVLGLVIALPALRLRALYVAVTTLALHFAVALALSVVQTTWLDSSALTMPLLAFGGYGLATPSQWYYFLLAGTGAAILGALNLLRSFIGRRWIATAEHDLAAAALGISVIEAKLSVFVTSSALVAVAGALQAYYAGTTSAETFSLGVAITYLAMIIVGGLGRVLGSVLGAILITVLPYLLDRGFGALGVSGSSSLLAGAHQVVFGALIVGFLLFEPRGVAELWRRIKVAGGNWPFRYRSTRGAGS